MGNENYEYYLITGEHGTGKTTLMRLACNAVGKGVIYVDVPDEVEKFGKMAASALKYDFSKHITVWNTIRQKILGMDLGISLAAVPLIMNKINLQRAILERTGAKLEESCWRQ